MVDLSLIRDRFFKMEANLLKIYILILSLYCDKNACFYCSLLVDTLNNAGLI